jgi:hypothetical protein
MKKVLLTAAVVAANLVAFAQETSSDSFMPMKGDKTFEVEAVSPFSGGGAAPFSLNNASLRFRYFLSDQMAVRVNFGLNMDNQSRDLSKGGETQTTTDAAGVVTTVKNTATIAKASQSTFGFSLMPGIEFHKSVAKRLDVYYGAVVDFTLKSRSAKAEISKAGRSGVTGITDDYFKGTETVEISGTYFDGFDDISLNNHTSAAAQLGFANSNKHSTSADDAGFTKIGLNVVLGADYYFMKSAYIGVEVMIGAGYRSIHNVTVTEISDIKTFTSTDKDNNESVTPFYNGGSFLIEPNTTAAFRLGVKF